MPCDPSLTTSLTRSKYGKSTSAIECPSTYTSVTSAKCKRPKMSQRPYLRDFLQSPQISFLFFFTKNIINPSRLSSEAGSHSPFYQISLL